MSDLRKAAQQALEVLRLNNDEWKALADSGDCGHWTAESQDHYKQTNAAIVALEAALAQEQAEPVQEPDYWQEEARRYAGNADYWRKRYEALAEPVEPVAWYFEARHIDSAWSAAVSLKHPGPEGVYMRNVKPLYTAPPQRPPLTDEEIDAITRDRWGTKLLGAMMQMHREYARAIERKARGEA